MDKPEQPQEGASFAERKWSSENLEHVNPQQTYCHEWPGRSAELARTTSIIKHFSLHTLSLH
jgi:hypothetical protein